ncbi:hypothetical protein PLEOSDRAFT_165203 [Pleurotus ostreatus PC15]|uniref:DUF6534 domain-containing protein n=1 Tax=Pleurotus ostreatus (strain PC15) TaxID=1137138 RepID=A0A067NXS9_PLEO1|nr:hypothetical protein PLEOSDRAFT_165203 [Pleurotus ostreatus PC15]
MSGTPNTPPQAGPTMLPTQGPIPGGAIPFPKMPAMDNTLGAMFIGASLAMLTPLTRREAYTASYAYRYLYTSPRAALGEIVVGPGCSSYSYYTVHQAMTTAAMYKFLISDFVNPLALASKAAGSGNVFIFAQSVSATCGILLAQLYADAAVTEGEMLTPIVVPRFFSWRIWAFSGTSLNPPARMSISILTVLLALFSFGSSVDLALEGFNHQLLTSTGPGLILRLIPLPDQLAYKLSASSRVVFDLFVTFAMTLALYRSRSGVKRTDHVITLLIMFTVNTNLLTTLFSVSELVTFLVMPQATLYGALGLLSPKLYLNTLLASLNSREYMQKELTGTTTGSNVIYPARVTVGGSSLQSSVHERDKDEEVSNVLDLMGKTS